MEIKKTLEIQMNKLKELSEERTIISNEIYNIMKSRYVDMMKSATDRAYIALNAKHMYENMAIYTLNIFRDEVKSIYNNTREKDYTKIKGHALDYSSDFGRFVSNRVELQVLDEKLIDVLCKEIAGVIVVGIDVSAEKTLSAGSFVIDVLRLISSEYHHTRFDQMYSSKFKDNITSFELHILQSMDKLLGKLLNIFGIKSLITNNEAELTLLIEKGDDKE